MEILVKSNSPSMSEDIRALAQSFLLAKQNFLNTGFGGKNSHQGYKYAKIEDIYNAVEGSLGKNNIIIWHFAKPSDDKEYLHTRLIHTLTGQFIEDCRIMESEKPGNQAKGSANTYMKKYAVLSLCAIATEDDDGEEEQKHMEKNGNEPLVSQEQLNYLAQELQSCSNGPILLSNILSFNKISELSQLKASCFNAVKSNIDKKRK